MSESTQRTIIRFVEGTTLCWNPKFYLKWTP